MRKRNLLGLVALVPAALNIASPAHAEITVLLCRGDGTTQEVTLPIGSGGLPAPATESGCCVKACHGGSSRKRTNCHI